MWGGSWVAKADLTHRTHDLFVLVVGRQMVHNGIEYGDMQLISEVYDILKV